MAPRRAGAVLIVENERFDSSSAQVVRGRESGLAAADDDAIPHTDRV